MPSPSPTRLAPLPFVLACAALTGALLVSLSLSLVGGADAEARMPGHAPGPGTTGYTCEIPTDPPASVRSSFQSKYDCMEPLFDEWFAKYPQHMERLKAQYEVWKSSRQHDLRDQSEAARFVRNHPVDFSSSHEELTADDVASLEPTMSAQPPTVAGTFERFFVDRDQERLFLTTDDKGLTSLDISQRFAFQFEGTMDQAGGRDFFVVDENTALLEEENDDKSARDLVVLDISDRSAPREVHRLHGVLPRVTRPALTSIPDRPPTFDEYRAIRRGQVHLSQCMDRPSIAAQGNYICRPDGNCFRQEHRDSPTDEGYCERRATRPAPTPRFHARQQPAPNHGPDVGDRLFDMEMEESAGRIGSDDAMPQAQAAPEPPASRRSAPSAPAERERAPQGGDGGAGSLSQMMVIGSTLYVLSADDHLDHGWLTTFDIAEPRRPQLSHVIGLDNGPEALQRHDNLLLIAGRDALVTASTAIPDGPRLLGERRQSCPVDFDPVVVEGAIAYRTIIIDQPRSTCNSRLEVIDLSQPHQPNLRTTRNIDRPRGLAVHGERLFVANERRGVHVFDITDPVTPSEAATWKLPGVKDLVLSGFDLYAMTDDQVSTYFVGPLFQSGLSATDAASTIRGTPTVLRAK